MKNGQKLTATIGIIYVLCSLVGGTLFVFMIGMTQSLLLALAGILLIISGHLRNVYYGRRLKEDEEAVKYDFKCE